MGITDHCQFDDSQMPRLLTILNSLWSFASPRLCVRGTPPTIISSCRDFLSVRRLADETGSVTLTASLMDSL